MGYTHRWKIKLDTALFPEPLIQDAREVVLNFFPILKDVDVNSTFLLKEDHGYDPFFFHHKNYHNEIKTGSL